MAATPYGPTTHCVLHVDVDAFFCQVETLRNPALRGLPIAIIQDRDVIAVSYPARQAGVKKYMNPAKARDILHAAGGRLVRVFQEADSRVSYRPYREASAALMHLLRSGLPPPHNLSVQVVEKASIDEAFILVALPAAGTSRAAPHTSANSNRNQHVATAAGGLTPSHPIAVSAMAEWVSAHPHMTWDLSAGTAVAAAVRTAVQQSLGLTVSVGVAPNKLLAKLASRMAKPDGVHVLDGVQRVQELLARTPVDRLPGLGGAVAAALVKHSITHIAQLQQHSTAQLSLMLGGQQQAKLAERLAEAGWGRDTSAVVDKGPPKSIQVQLALNAHLWRARIQNAEEAAAAVAASGQPPQRLPPPAVAPEALSVGAADTLTRLQAILQAVTGDLLGRVLLDRHSEDRWPKKLSLTLGVYIPGQPLRSISKSTTFPPPALHTTAAAATAPASAGAASTADMPQPGPVTELQQQQASGTSHSPAGKLHPSLTAAGAAPASPNSRFDPAGAMAAAAPTAAGPAFAAPGVLGEKSFSVGAALRERVVQLALGLAQAILTPLPSHQCVGHLNLAVGNFGPYESAATAGDIRKFATSAAGSAKTTNLPQQRTQQQRLQAAGTTAADDVQPVREAPTTQQQQRHDDRSTVVAGSVSVPKAVQPGQAVQRLHSEHHQQRVLGSVPAAEQGAKRKRDEAGFVESHLDHADQQQGVGTLGQARPPLPRQQLTGNQQQLQLTGKLHAADPQPQYQQQQQRRTGVVPARQPQQHQQRHELLVVPSQPPVLLSNVLQHLAHSSTTVEAAEQQLNRLLAAVGCKRLLMPP